MFEDSGKIITRIKPVKTVVKDTFALAKKKPDKACLTDTGGNTRSFCRHFY